MAPDEPVNLLWDIFDKPTQGEWKQTFAAEWKDMSPDIDANKLYQWMMHSLNDMDLRKQDNPVVKKEAEWDK